MPYSQIYPITNMSFNAIRENKILTKISESTVDPEDCRWLCIIVHLQ